VSGGLHGQQSTPTLCVSRIVTRHLRACDLLNTAVVDFNDMFWWGLLYVWWLCQPVDIGQ